MFISNGLTFFLLILNKNLKSMLPFWVYKQSLLQPFSQEIKGLGYIKTIYPMVFELQYHDIWQKRKLWRALIANILKGDDINKNFQCYIYKIYRCDTAWKYTKELLSDFITNIQDNILQETVSERHDLLLSTMTKLIASLLISLESKYRKWKPIINCHFNWFYC